MYIVIETHGGAAHATIVTDEEGNNKVWEADQRAEAQAEADDCQEGIVVEI